MTGSAIRKFTRTLAANAETVINVSGATAVQCTGATAGFSVRPDDRNPVELANGLGIRYQEEEAFNTLRITNEGTPQTIELYIGSGDVIDNRFSASGALSTRLLAAQSSAYGNVSVGTSATLVRAANTGRASILVQNLGAGTIYLGSDSSVTTANGIQAQPGAAVEFKVDDAIYAISSAAATDVRYFEESA